jgi:hypothetical protein
MSEKKELKAIITSPSFPSITATEEEKKSLAYGLKVAKSIEGEWFRNNGGGCSFYNRYAEFNKRRRYARGEQPIGMYQDLFKTNGDMSYINLDWSIVKVANKFVDIVVNGMNDRMYVIKAQSEDISTAEKRNLFQEMVEADMVAKDFLKLTKDQMGIDAYSIKPEEIPETDEELSLYMQLKFKPSVEIAAEVAISNLLEMNDYRDSIKPRLDYDLVTIGMAAAKHSFLPGAGVVLDYVDPANLVHSYTEKPDFSDCFYHGEVKTVHYTELRKINPDLTDEDLAQMRNYGMAWYNAFPEARTYIEDAFNDELVTLLFFDYKTEKRFVFKEKMLDNGGLRVIRRDESFNPEPNGDLNFARKDVVKEVWYDGVLLMGSNKLIKWGIEKNLVRPKTATQKAVSKYVVNAPRMYKGEIDSTVNRMIPHLNQIQLTHLKLQQIVQKLNPNGVYIDADGLVDIDLGNGGNYNPNEALNLYFQTGSVIGRSQTTEGEFNNGKIPIQELSSSSGIDKIQSLISAYNYHLNMIRDVTGLNEARDGSTPNPDALVGVQKLAALNSNTATNHIMKAGLKMTKELANGCYLRVSDILEYADFAEEFAMQVGKYNMAILEDIKDLYLHTLGIYIEQEPDEEDKSKLEGNIQMALSRDQIDLEDAIDIRLLKNIKLANELLKVKKKAKVRAQQKREDEQSAIQMQMNMQSQQAAAEMKQQQIQMESQVKASVKQTEISMEMEKLKLEAELKKELMAIEFDYSMQLKGMEVDQIKSIEDQKENRKDERVKLQATAQSKMIEQRHKDLPSVNFESNEDSLDGMDLSSFGPK